jgi:hypothetical protein
MPGKSRILSEKMTKANKDWGVAQMVECLLNRCEALSSKLSIGKKNFFKE